MNQTFPPPVDTGPIWTGAWWFIKLSWPALSALLAAVLLTNLVKRRRR
jgi:hypothetical protein